jgi:hypothetical protein
MKPIANQLGDALIPSAGSQSDLLWIAIVQSSFVALSFFPWSIYLMNKRNAKASRNLKKINFEDSSQVALQRNTASETLSETEAQLSGSDDKFNKVIELFTPDLKYDEPYRLRWDAKLEVELNEGDDVFTIVPTEKNPNNAVTVRANEKCKLAFKNLADGHIVYRRNAYLGQLLVTTQKTKGLDKSDGEVQIANKILSPAKLEKDEPREATSSDGARNLDVTELEAQLTELKALYKSLLPRKFGLNIRKV